MNPADLPPEQDAPSAGTQSHPWRILIVDDHPLVRMGLRSLLEAESDLRVCAEAGSVAEAMATARKHHPDLVITDLSLGDGNGLELIKRLLAQHAELRVLVCSMHDEKLFALRALAAGACGYVGKEHAGRHVVEAVRHALAGHIWLSQSMTDQALSNGGARPPTDAVASLTDRELAVFELIGRGMGPSQIAAQIHLSVKTVETHREKIKKKLNLQSGGDLTRSAMQWVERQR
ncbi:response regulator transcription factor [Thiomonas sp. FB-6]|uniref:response regulator transcription factor n=1 Tax=Thiomonas sp. FB-6 TaxID=1158291 RepID=UPI000382D58C|nr:response regulator transcription factor [Thiomonas sp. FB-6]